MLERGYSNVQPCEPVCSREPIAVEVVRIAEGLADRSQSLADRLIGKLHPVMNSANKTCGTEKIKEIECWPPMFDQLRGNFSAIRDALDKMEDALSRTEL